MERTRFRPIALCPHASKAHRRKTTRQIKNPHTMLIKPILSTPRLKRHTPRPQPPQSLERIKTLKLLTLAIIHRRSNLR